MSLAKWAAKNLKGKGAKIGEKIGEGYSKARGSIEGIFDAAEDAGGDLLKGAGNVAKGIMASHPGKSAAGIGGTSALLGAVGMNALDDDDDGPDLSESDLDQAERDLARESRQRRRSKKEAPTAISIYIGHKGLKPKASGGKSGY